MCLGKIACYLNPQVSTVSLINSDSGNEIHVARCLCTFVAWKYHLLLVSDVNTVECEYSKYRTLKYIVSYVGI